MIYLLSSIVGVVGIICAIIAVLWWRERSEHATTRRARCQDLAVCEHAIGRISKERDDARAQRDRLNSTCDMLKKALHTVDKDIEQYIDDNAAYKAQVEILVKTINDLSAENAMLQHDREHSTRPLEEMPTVDPVLVRSRTRKKVGSD